MKRRREVAPPIEPDAVLVFRAWDEDVRWVVTEFARPRAWLSPSRTEEELPTVELTHMETDVRLRSTGALRGSVRPPGSKSLTNRCLLCAALADGESTLQRASFSDDSARMVAGLEALGVLVRQDPEQQYFAVSGCGGFLPADRADIYVSGAGTAMRFLLALSCLGRGRFRLDGSARMRERPIGALVEGLEALGASIGYDQSTGFPPLTVVARGLSGGQVVFDRPPSSQYISALLMVAPYAARDVMLRIEGDAPSRPYLDMTMAVMRAFGVEILESDGRRFIIPSGQRYQAAGVTIEPDASAASYFWAAAAISGGCVRVEGLSRHSVQGDVGFASVLERMGCHVNANDEWIEVEGPRDGKLRGIEIDLNAMPDTVQTLAVVALFAGGPTKIRNVANLRLKETDRIGALATELSRLGARVETFGDGLTISPPAAVQPATIETYDDHRMAMSFSLAALRGTEMVIRSADCVRKSFPDFFEVFAGLRRE